jgi:SOS response regulatory protein OraA/RecX
VDGQPWRTVPDAVVVACGFAAGMELDRPVLRRLRAELRQTEALAAAGRVLHRRDVSRSGLDERLERAGIRAIPRERAITALAEAGAIDDRRFAERRALSLADRGWGDEAIRIRLESEGLDTEDVQAALAALAPETERAARVVARTRDPRKAWSLLARRGFDPETVAETVAPLDEGDANGLG